MKHYCFSSWLFSVIYQWLSYLFSNDYLFSTIYFISSFYLSHMSVLSIIVCTALAFKQTIIAASFWCGEQSLRLSSRLTFTAPLTHFVKQEFLMYFSGIRDWHTVLQAEFMKTEGTVNYCAVSPQAFHWGWNLTWSSSHFRKMQICLRGVENHQSSGTLIYLSMILTP